MTTRVDLNADPKLALVCGGSLVLRFTLAELTTQLKVKQAEEPRWPTTISIHFLAAPVPLPCCPKYDVPSRAEYYTFVQGPASDGIDVRVSWPGVEVETVVHMDERLRVRRDRDDPTRIVFRLPVNAATIDSLQPTIQVWSHPVVTDSFDWRIEHNDPDRVAGPWTSVPWPAGQVRSQIHQLFATEAIWRDSGLLATAAAKGHRWVLMGFETNNTLHADNPPHWQMSHNAGPDWSSSTCTSGSTPRQELLQRHGRDRARPVEVLRRRPGTALRLHR